MAQLCNRLLDEDCVQAEEDFWPAVNHGVVQGKSLYLQVQTELWNLLVAQPAWKCASGIAGHIYYHMN